MAIRSSLSAPAGVRRLALGCLAALLATAAYALALGAAPSQAVVKGAFGVQPRGAVALEEASLRYHGGPILSSSVTYAIYWDPTGAYRSDWLRLIDGYLHDVGADSGRLSNIFAVDTQYTGPAGTRANYQSTFRGAYSDTDKYPVSGCSETQKGAVCLTDEQIRGELAAFIEANHLPTGLGVVYFVLTPPKLNVCTDEGGHGNCSLSTAKPSEEPNGFCGYHSAIAPGGASPVVYAVQPWTGGSAGRITKQLPLETEAATPDVIACQNRSSFVEANQSTEKSPYGDYETADAEVVINGLSAEQLDMVINPLLNGWYQTGTSEEEGDVCQGVFSPAPEQLPPIPETTKALPLSDETINGHNYYLQWAFNSTGVTSGKGITCWQGVEHDPHFTHPNPVNLGDIVGFDANESSFTLDANIPNLSFPAEEPFTAPIYTWDFGDGTVVTSGNASIFHSYSSAGTFQAALTVTDSGANVRTFSSTVTVVGPGAGGGSGGSGSSQGAQSSASSSSGTGSGSPGGGKPAPKPSAAATVASHSLRRVLASGLVIRYSVSERVTGRFEVLLASSIARRLHLHGASATGLPSGTPPQTVIGKAILITTAGGHNSLRIHFAKSTAASLAHMRKVTLLLRMFVRNSAAARTTLLSTVTLSH